MAKNLEDTYYYRYPRIEHGQRFPMLARIVKMSVPLQRGLLALPGPQRPGDPEAGEAQLSICGSEATPHLPTAATANTGRPWSNINLIPFLCLLGSATPGPFILGPRHLQSLKGFLLFSFLPVMPHTTPCETFRGRVYCTLGKSIPPF